MTNIKEIPLGLVVTNNLWGMTIRATDEYVATVYAVLEGGLIDFPRSVEKLELEKGDFMFAYEAEDRYDLFRMPPTALKTDTLVKLIDRYIEKNV